MSALSAALADEASRPPGMSSSHFWWSQAGRGCGHTGWRNSPVPSPTPQPYWQGHQPAGSGRGQIDCRSRTLETFLPLMWPQRDAWRWPASSHHRPPPPPVHLLECWAWSEVRDLQCGLEGPLMKEGFGLSLLQWGWDPACYRCLSRVSAAHGDKLPAWKVTDVGSQMGRLSQIPGKSLSWRAAEKGWIITEAFCAMWHQNLCSPRCEDSDSCGPKNPNSWTVQRKFPFAPRVSVFKAISSKSL